ncbi:MAG: hypothetical protein ACKV0T_29990 [Planctomycetales bacterium]
MTGVTTLWPLLAARNNPQDLLVVVVVILVWVGIWIVKMITAQKKNVPPVSHRPGNSTRQEDAKIFDEIDDFIREVGGNRPVASKPRPPARPSPPAPTRPAAGGRSKPAPSTPSPQVSGAKRRRPGQELATRQAPVSNSLGTGVQEHLRQHMTERVAKETAAHLQDKVEVSVAQHLGTLGSGATVTAPPVGNTQGTSEESWTARTSQLRALFQNAGALRQAMIVSMVLAPPPGLKPRPPADVSRSG